MKTPITIAAALAMALPAFAQTAMDTDADGYVTMEEAQAALPDMSAEVFAALDGDADGVLNADEVQAGIDAGVLPS